MQPRQVPAEIVIERPHPMNNFKWVWAVCQPDACWGEWEGGTCYSEEDAKRYAAAALHRTWVKQGVIRPHEGIYG